MAALTDQLRQGAEHAWASMTEGWRDLRARASGALTRFRHVGAPGAPGVAPEQWGLMAADVLVDDECVVVRIEAPGMTADDLHIDLDRDRLTVTGEKRVDRTSGSGRYRVVQCAYGSFRRDVALPTPVDVGRAEASYRDGVLRIEIPRLEHSRARRIPVRGA